jgi:creatinine amidohydrolase
MTAPELREVAAQKRSTAILPVGSLEQHGPHLPVLTDTIGVAAACHAGARLAAGSRPLAVLPAIWLGLSEYHIPFGGTISLDNATYQAMLRCIVRSLKALGFERLLVVNGHGGNIAPLEISTRELAVEFDIPIVATTPWLNIEVHDIAESDEVVEHGCEAETSLILALAPDCVRPQHFEYAASTSRHRRPEKAFTRFYSFTDCAPLTGTWGDPRTATPEKGLRFLDRLGKAVADIILDERIWFPPEAVWSPGRGLGRTDWPDPAPESGCAEP